MGDLANAVQEVINKLNKENAELRSRLIEIENRLAEYETAWAKYAESVGMSDQKFHATWARNMAIVAAYEKGQTAWGVTARYTNLCPITIAFAAEHTEEAKERVYRRHGLYHDERLVPVRIIKEPRDG